MLEGKPCRQAKKKQKHERSDLSQLPSVTLDILILILELTWLEHSRDAHCSLSFSRKFLLRFEFLLLQEQLCVIASRELLELDKEITKSELEAGDVVVILRQGCDEDLNLRANDRNTR